MAGASASKTAQRHRCRFFATATRPRAGTGPPGAASTPARRAGARERSPWPTYPPAPERPQRQPPGRQPQWKACALPNTPNPRAQGQLPNRTGQTNPDTPSPQYNLHVPTASQNRDTSTRCSAAASATFATETLPPPSNHSLQSATHGHPGSTQRRTQEARSKKTARTAACTYIPQDTHRSNAGTPAPRPPTSPRHQGLQRRAAQHPTCRWPALRLLRPLCC